MTARRGMTLVISGFLASASSAGLRAQDLPRSAVVVDFVAGEDIYLGIGASQGVEVGDTLALFRSQEPNSVAFARALVTGASRARSVVVVLDDVSPLVRGDVLYVVTSGPGGTAEQARVSDNTVAARPAQRPDAATPTGLAQAQSGPRWSGLASVDVAARESTVSWSGNLAGETRRRFATPTGRLTLRGTGLPGGWRVDASLRAAYRYTDGPVVTPTTSIRAYGLSVANRIQGLGMDVRLGRFYNPFETYSGYWDGLLVRVGSERGAGIGVVAGLQPNRYNEAPSQETRKISAFVNYSAGRGAKWYSTDASFHVIRPGNGPVADRTFLGWSQRATLGTVRVDQRLQVDRDEGTGTWSLTRLRVRSSVGLGPARLEVGVGRSKPSYLRYVEGVTAPSRDQANLGLTMDRRGIRASIRVGVTESDGVDRGMTIGGSVRGSLGRMGLSASASRWSRSTMTTISFSPGVDFRIGRSQTRLRYRYYRVDGLALTTSHTAEIGTSLYIQGGLQLRVQAQQQWGLRYQGTQIITGLSKAF